MKSLPPPKIRHKAKIMKTKHRFDDLSPNDEDDEVDVGLKNAIKDIDDVIERTEIEPIESGDLNEKEDSDNENALMNVLKVFLKYLEYSIMSKI